LKVLILNHHHKECGVYQFAKRVFDLASKSQKISYFYREIEYGDPSTHISSRTAYYNVLTEIDPDYIVYNWHWDRMPWLREDDLTSNKRSKHYFMWHDGSMMRGYDKYIFFGGLDPDQTAVPVDKRILLPRPLYNYNGVYPRNDLITIGSFGFAFLNKRFPDLVKLVNNEFDRAILNIHMTNPYFGDTPGNVLSEIVSACNKNNTNPNIKLNINTNFVDDDAVLTFLAGNDINVFYYDLYRQVGLSSAIDYALSVKRPIAITNHTAFRHIVSDEILIENNSIEAILNRGTRPIDKYYDIWDTNVFTLEMEKLFI